MGDPADIGPQYRCEECGVWGPDTTCMQCGAELGEAEKGVPGVCVKKVIAEGHVAPQFDCKVTINGVDLDESNQVAFLDVNLVEPRPGWVWNEYARLVEKTDEAIRRAVLGEPKKPRG